MTIKRTSGSSSRSLKKASRNRETSLGESIIRGLQEGIAHARGEIKLCTRTIHVPDEVDVRAIRENSGMSQSEFAARYGFSPRTLQEWEQRRASPDNAVRAYLTVIARNPRAVEEALKRAS